MQAVRRYRRIYRIVFGIITLIMAGEFIFADSVIASKKPLLLLAFIPAELLIVFVWAMILRYNHNSALAIAINEGVAHIETLGGKSYRVTVSEIRVQKAFFNYRLKFGETVLNASSTNKSVGAFIDKCRNVPHRKR